jgi:hypothetical protein
MAIPAIIIPTYALVMKTFEVAAKAAGLASAIVSGTPEKPLHEGVQQAAVVLQSQKSARTADSISAEPGQSSVSINSKR